MPQGKLDVHVTCLMNSSKPLRKKSCQSYTNLLLKMFINLFLRERERESACKEQRDKEKKRETENPKQALHHQQRAQHGAQAHKP